MLPSGLSWATFALLVLTVSCANDFVTSNSTSRSFPSQFGAGRTTTIYWTNLTGFIAGIYVTGNGQSDDSADYNWVLDSNCPEDSDSTCTAHDNRGSTQFYVNETAVPLGSGYRLRLLWTNSKTYDDVDDDTEEVDSSEFSVVPAESLPEPDHPDHGLGPAEQAGISIAVIVVVIFLLLVAWFRWRKAKRRRERRERAMRNVQDKEQGGWYERWTAGKPTKNTEESWTASSLPTKPDPAVSAAAAGAGAAGIRKVSKTDSDGQQQPYLDDKAEMPAGADGANRHEIDSLGTSAARNKTELDGTSAPQGGLTVAELPAEPVSGQTSSSQSRTVSTATTFEYNPNPSYALQPPASPRPEADLVSPISEGVGTYNSLAGSVSPVTPIARKPVGGTVSTIPEQEQQQYQYGGAWRQDMLTVDAADEAPKRGKSAMLRKEKSRIWKMLGGGSTKGKLNPSGGANV